ncbi:MAG TPA: hypothetical protein DEO84_03635 [candidate division Zixibacteria bacterium]|nr:hypothetical protein [candidate division Zixibacteria bacterium]HBZ00394.1 hypothetical protein [candidate division Zixibacteria bacterium]
MKPALIAILLLILWPVLSMGSPRIFVPETHWDYGNVPQNSVLTHDYLIRNTGNDTLNIIDVKPGCGCTTAPIQKKTLAPGESTTVALVFNTKTSRGKVSKNAKITSNDITQVSLTIDFAANIVVAPDTVSDIRLEPYKMVFSKDTARNFITVDNLDSLPVNLTMIGSPVDGVKTKVKNANIKKGESSKLEFDWKGSVPEYDDNHVITFETGIPKGVTRFSIPYTIKGTKGPKQAETKPVYPNNVKPIEPGKPAVIDAPTTEQKPEGQPPQPK